jgi:hypothetical protein
LKEHHYSQWLQLRIHSIVCCLLHMLPYQIFYRV